jgi:hypothetical protein
MKFYTALRAGLNACGFSPHLLQILPRICLDVDLVITPIVAESALIIGSGNDPAALRTLSILQLCELPLSLIGKEHMIVLG